MAKELTKNISKEHWKNGVIDQGKYKKISSEIKWTGIQYRVQDNSDVAQKYVNIYCDTNKIHME